MKLKKLFSLIVTLLLVISVTLSVAACGNGFTSGQKPFGGNTTDTDQTSVEFTSEPNISEDDQSDGDDYSETEESGDEDEDETVIEITDWDEGETTVNSSHGENAYELTVSAKNGDLSYSETDDYIALKVAPTSESKDPEINLSGEYSGCVMIVQDEETNVTVNLNGCTIYAYNELPALYVYSAKNADISAKKGTANYIYDYRERVDNLSYAILSTCDLKLKGNGSLTVLSENNKGIHGKDDLELKNLTLSVTCKDNALKGNDSVSIESGTYTLIASQGDAIKTSDSSTYSSSGEQKGTVTVSGGTLKLYAACDGIDAAYDVIISGNPVIEIYTDKYSEYSEEVTFVSEAIYYIRNTTSAYKYSVYYYNSSDASNGVWKNTGSYTAIRSGRGTYYYYTVEKPSGYDSMQLFIYNSSQIQGQSQNCVYNARFAVNDDRDMLVLNNTTISSWSNYTTQPAGGFGGGPGGGMNEGNPDKGDYSTKGIKADNAITISGGTITVKSYDDALHANSDNTLESGATPTGSITISGGTLELYSGDDAIHADGDLTVKEEAYINITYAYEGIEGNRIYFEGGTTYVYAKNDAVNAKSGKYTPLVNISGGYIDLATPSGDTDTLDSNGNIVMTGGTVILKNGQSNGTSMTGGTIDIDGSMTVSGGNLISVGCWCTEANSAPQQTYNYSSTLSAGEYTLKDGSGNEILSFTLTSSYRGYRFYLSGKTGTYYLYKGDTQVLSF
ncbi:MAG: carbohydrate-binding domain-containing protein [Clostridia bacterium]|nr:carbohydrate-binding domain-containing protein [Clostridia bacterium]